MDACAGRGGHGGRGQVMERPEWTMEERGAMVVLEKAQEHLESAARQAAGYGWTFEAPTEEAMKDDIRKRLAWRARIYVKVDSSRHTDEIVAAESEAPRPAPTSAIAILDTPCPNCGILHDQGEECPWWKRSEESPPETARPTRCIFDGMAWPIPNLMIGWKMRYGNPTQEERLEAQEEMNAYNTLLALPQGRRNYICRKIRKAMNGRK